MVMVDDVGEHERRRLQPGDSAQGRHVGLQREIAVALAPARRRVTRHRLHVDVVGQQIAAGVSFLVRGFDEVFRMKALADELPRHVGEGDDDGVDLARADRGFQGVEGQHTGHRGLGVRSGPSPLFPRTLAYAPGFVEPVGRVRLGAYPWRGRER